MIILLSPAKTLDYSKDFNFQPSVPTFLNDSSKLVKGLKSKEPKDIASLMSLSDKLATLNFERFQSWSAAKKIGADAKHALFVFKGDVYQGPDIVSQADWVLWLVKNKSLSSYTWIGNKNSTPLDDSVVQLNWNYSSFLKEELKIDTYKFDYIYVCASPQYLAPHHWYYFDIMKMLYKNYSGSDPKMHQDKFGYDLKKFYKYKDKEV